MTNIRKNQPRIERVDDIPVIYGMLKRMDIQGSVDSLVTPNGNWTGLTPGWIISVWLIHILSEQNYLTEPVQQWDAICGF